MAIREAEAWLLADRSGLSDYLSIPEKWIPVDTARIKDPKRYIVRMAARSSRKEIRADIAPPKGSKGKTGSYYTQSLSSFAKGLWQIDETSKHSESLRRAKAAIDVLCQLTNYVQMHYQNNLGILLSSGFTATKTPTPVGPLGAPQNARLTRTEMTGEVLFRFSAVYGTTAGYLVQIATDSEGPFTEYVNTSSTRVLIDGRTPFAKVWARVRATGTAGPGPWSEPTCIIVL